MVDASFMQIFCFVLVLTLAMAFAAYLSKREFWNGIGGGFLELAIWTGSLLAGVGADYLLVTLNNNMWVSA